MPLVAVPFITGLNKYAAHIVGCTKEEYEKYQMGDTDKINSHTVAMSFFKDYATAKGKSVKDIDKFGVYSIEQKEDFKAAWYGSNVVTIVILRKLLNGFDLDYAEFIDAYCEYLKTVNF